MKKENTEYLWNNFPILYEYCPYFECEDGWFFLIKDLSEKLEKLIKNVSDAKCRATQIKEKYGTLRFYMSAETDEMSKEIEKYTAQSAKICEICGNKGTLNVENNWLSIRCDKCTEN